MIEETYLNGYTYEACMLSSDLAKDSRDGSGLGCDVDGKMEWKKLLWERENVNKKEAGMVFVVR